MKRSTLCKNIERQLLKVDPSLQDIEKRRLQHIINTIIGLAEGNGMLPPSISTEDMAVGHWPINEWEPEG